MLAALQAEQGRYPPWQAVRILHACGVLSLLGASPVRPPSSVILSLAAAVAPRAAAAALHPISVRELYSGLCYLRITHPAISVVPVSTEAQIEDAWHALLAYQHHSPHKCAPRLLFFPLSTGPS